MTPDIVVAPLFALLVALLAGAWVNHKLSGAGWPAVAGLALLQVLLPLAALWLTAGWSLQALFFSLVFGGMQIGVGLVGRDGRVPQWPLWTLMVFLAVAIWLSVTGQWPLLVLLPDLFRRPDVLLLVFAYLVVTWLFSQLMRVVVAPWAARISDPESLPRAGALIGILERVLILTFILIDQFAAIGFLLAAKSILRFGSTQEAEHRKLTEYVLIGTLASFALTILFGIGVRYVLAALGDFG